MNEILCAVVRIYIILLVGRAILSWFPLDPNSPMRAVFSFLYTITEPLLGPLRRIIPPAGGFDLSFIVLILGLQLIVAPLVCNR